MGAVGAGGRGGGLSTRSYCASFLRFLSSSSSFSLIHSLSLILCFYLLSIFLTFLSLCLCVTPYRRAIAFSLQPLALWPSRLTVHRGCPSHMASQVDSVGRLAWRPFLRVESRGFVAKYTRPMCLVNRSSEKSALRGGSCRAVGLVRFVQGRFREE